eukprot:2545599-Alexandrium_andersonii.AAC.1
MTRHMRLSVSSARSWHEYTAGAHQHHTCASSYCPTAGRLRRCWICARPLARCVRRFSICA